MTIVKTSIAALAAVGFVAGATSAATACEWAKTANSSPAPAQEEMAAPATQIDPVVLAEVGKIAIVPRPPEEEIVAE